MKMVEAKKDPPSCIQAMEGSRCQTKVLVAKNPLSPILSEEGLSNEGLWWPKRPLRLKFQLREG